MGGGTDEVGYLDRWIPAMVAQDLLGALSA